MCPRNKVQEPIESKNDEGFENLEAETAANLVNVAEDFVESGEFESAVEVLNVAATLCPTNASIYELRGRIFWEVLDETEKACLDFEMALYLNPNLKVAREVYASILFLVALHYDRVLKNYENAARMLFGCLDLNPLEIYLRRLLRLKKKFPELVVPEKYANMLTQHEFPEKYSDILAQLGLGQMEAHEDKPHVDKPVDATKKQRRRNRRAKNRKRINKNSLSRYEGA